MSEGAGAQRERELLQGRREGESSHQKELKEYKLNEITLTPEGTQKELKEYKLNENTLTPEGTQKVPLLLKETLVSTRSRRCHCCSRRYRCSGV